MDSFECVWGGLCWTGGGDPCLSSSHFKNRPNTFKYDKTPRGRRLSTFHGCQLSRLSFMSILCWPALTKHAFVIRLILFQTQHSELWMVWFRTGLHGTLCPETHESPLLSGKVQPDPAVSVTKRDCLHFPVSPENQEWGTWFCTSPPQPRAL